MTFQERDQPSSHVQKNSNKQKNLIDVSLVLTKLVPSTKRLIPSQKIIYLYLHMNIDSLVFTRLD